MKLVKKIVMGAAVAITAAGLAVAQDAALPSFTGVPALPARVSALEDMEPKSMTSISTAELFGNAVDDFMNVNEYQNVQPEHLFGYLGYGKKGSDEYGAGKINFGLAHQFNKFYLAGWFGGQINKWTVENKKNDKTGMKKDETTTAHGDKNAVYGKVLFGLGNMGIMANFAFKPDGTANKYVDDRDKKTKTTDNRFALNTSVKFGINLNGKNDKVYKTWAELGLNSRVSKHEENKDGKISLLDTSIYRLNLNGGTSFDLYEANDIVQTLDLELDTGWDIYSITFAKSDSKSVVQNGAFGMEIAFKPAWTLAYEPEDSKFGFKTKVGLENKLTYVQDPDNAVGDGKTEYAASRKYVTKFDITPSLAVGAIYKVVPEKFQLNGGASFKVPSGNWDNTKTQHRNSNTASKIDWTEENGTWTAKSATGKLDLNSGFTWTPSEKVTIDANWNILKAVFTDDFRTDFDNTNFWKNVNTLVFQNFGFLVSVKL